MARGVAYIGLGKPRSFAHDALYALADFPVPPLVRGEDWIPASGPLVVTANHYERPGLWMTWPVLYLTHLVEERTGQDTHWVAIEEWETLSFHGIPVPRSLIRLLFSHTFATYGILAMPSPDAPAGERAAAIRAAARLVRHQHTIGLMPEGTVGPTPELLPARPGVGTFLLLLAAAGARILPVGLFEEDCHLVANIGQPFHLAVPPETPKDGRDTAARQRVMLAIRDLLPEPLWGAYRPAGLTERGPGSDL
ncbi:MAG: 1-acyl-sn-glycerol-3-phosphate acyltransferase [Chloroflexota bacterium]